MKKIFIILFCWLLNSQLSFTAGVSEPKAKAETKRKPMPISGPNGYEQLIKEGKLDGPLTLSSFLVLKKLLENAELDIVDNIPLRTYLSEFNLYPKDKIYSKDPVAELRAAIVKKRKEKSFLPGVILVGPTQEDYELYKKDNKAYLRYLKNCKKDEKEENICLSYEEWQKQNSYEEWVQKNNELLKAIKKGDIKTIQELLEDSADVNARDKSDYTVIMNVIASSIFLTNQEKIDIIKLLIDAGADINAKARKGTNTGFTALHFAASRSELPVVKFLLSSGADINAADAQGNTPLDIATRNNDKTIAILLRKAGAKSNKYSPQLLNQLAPI